jgi:arylsulfatase A-like enzyme
MSTPPRLHHLLAWLAAFAGTGSAISHAAPTARPNILHLHADDHRPDGLHALGNPILQTPHLDTLVARGFTFTRCYTMGSMIGAVCLPSRTMMLSGRSLFRIPGRGETSPQVTPLPTLLARAGYQTWHLGKGGNEFTAGLRAFETNLVDDAKGKTPDDSREHASRRLADKAIEFLTQRDRTKPFYAYLAPPVPHDPRVSEGDFRTRYDPAKIPLSPSFQPQHPWDNGDMAVRDEQLAPWPRTPDDTRRQLADYYACITALDHHIGRIFAALRATGQWENTVIIFTGDNGLSMGDHGLFGKQNLYEFGGMHVPCVIAGPGIPQGRSHALAYLMDLYPTFADFAGAVPPADIEGRSLRPIIEGKASRIRDVLYTAYRDGQRALRDDRWKLIRYPLVDRTQLFDLDADPRELTNLATQPAHAARVAAMLKRLGAEMRAYNDATPLSVPKPAPADWSPPPPSAPKAKKSK